MFVTDSFGSLITLYRMIPGVKVKVRCASGCVVECRICNREVAGWNLEEALYQVYAPFTKVKVHTLDMAPLRSETPPHKSSDMARVLDGFHSFT